MIVKKTNSRELVRTAEGGRVELAERHLGRYTDRRTYGMTLEGGVLTLWIEDEDGRRKTVRTMSLADDEAKRLREDMMRVKNFTAFGTLLFFYMYLRDKLKGRHADPRL
jgi:hypothetical protein